ncbi:DUF1489 family protein [Hoeflea prorocentri]|uniref:DUF1489 family protein n=1 Tax=Hoeflea prorocentri TaxID=1922333 RepID=A0A9X3UGX9_9HYPH|nr:DUF1489 family protein [Hoeflea prorocentri]MCY6380650.1 DUF1489 family protein [Hoeflea prorocentri]MDA5398450.1 DUF1489 family protein [Hoeflea prorocentri]
MTLNLVKLCVGVESVEDLQASIDFGLADKKSRGLEEIQYHTTRMVPKRLDELLDGGSLYWVIKGNIQVRQYIVEIRPFTDKADISRCRIVLEPRLVLTQWQPRRAFQGWRYLTVKDAPADLSEANAGLLKLPPELRRELADLGLL